MRFCQTCGKPIVKNAVISRRDRNVRLCQSCGYREGLLVAGISRQEADQIVARIQMAGGFTR